MKRLEFYTATRDYLNGGVKAVKVKGYTDGTFNYYFSRPFWRAIEPTSGLMVTQHYNKENTVEEAHSLRDLVQSKMKEPYYKLRVEIFNRAVKEAEEGVTE